MSMKGLPLSEKPAVCLLPPQEANVSIGPRLRADEIEVRFLERALENWKPAPGSSGGERSSAPRSTRVRARSGQKKRNERRLDDKSGSDLAFPEPQDFPMRRSHLIGLLAPAVCLSVAFARSSPAQSSAAPFPLDPAPAPPAIDGLVMKPAADRIAALEPLSSVTLHGVPLPGGARVDVELERLPVDAQRFGFRVDGVARPDLFPDLLGGLALSVWKGTVVGHPDSEVMLSFSRHGSRGWIQTNEALVHFVARPDARGDWSRGDVLVVSEESLNRQGLRPDFVCGATRPRTSGPEPARAPRVDAAVTQPRAGIHSFTGICGLRVCKMAIEGDWQLYQKFNDLAAETAYLTTLLSFTSDRYATQASTVLTFPYFNLWSTPNDPWHAQDNGGTSQDVLNELTVAWGGNIPAGADVAQLLSGALLGGGVAWLDVLCDHDFGFSVCGNLNGQMPFPLQVGPTNWDFGVVTHELGHNFNAIHTHEYCPPIDQCAPASYFGPCQTNQVCTNQGTVMSYCHLCSGGSLNMTTYFHPASSADMTAAAASCLPMYASIVGTAPELLAPNTPTPLSAEVAGSTSGSATLWVRPGPGTFTPIAMTNQGGGHWTATLPPASCSATPQFYYSFTDAQCGVATDPAGAPNNVHTASVGTPVPVLLDNFENNLGWASSTIGATAGLWVRAVPIYDLNWPYSPSHDFDGSGKCWVTENGYGPTDVDGGTVQLMSPQFSLTGGPALISYAYFLYLSIADGVDRMVVEASSNDTNGPWIEVVRHDTNGGTSWHTHEIRAADLAAAGIAQTATMRLRFRVNDGGTPSTVEAALDAFKAWVLPCPDIGSNYCSPAANSTGQPAFLWATGTHSVAANDLVLHAGPVPTTTNGILFLGSSQAYVPLGNGFRCVGGTLLRMPPAHATNGQLQFNVNNAVPPLVGHVIAGSTWNFQAWYRDVPAGGAQFNLSDGYQVVFTP
jgi:hypothetical protein